jgi:hypothetical protein
MTISPQLNNYITENDGYHQTNLIRHASPTMSKLDKLWVKHDNNGYHYRNYYQASNNPELHYNQIYTNLPKPLKAGDTIGSAKIM